MRKSTITHYKTLGVEPMASGEDVRGAYRKLAREYHPDLNPDPDAHERMAQINAAFEILSDPVRRSEYDASIGLNPDLGDVETGAVRKPSVVRTKIIYRHRAHSTPVYGISFRDAQSGMLTSSFDNEIISWSPDLGTVDTRTHLDGGVVSSIQTTPNGFVAAGSTEQSISCWRFAGGEPRSWRKSPREWVISVAPSPDGKWLALGTVGHDAQIVDVIRGDDRFLLQGHKESVTALAWSPNGRTLATGSGDATVRLWNARSGACMNTLQRVRSSVTAIAWSPDGSRVAVAAVDLSIRVIDVQSGALISTFHGHERPVETLSFHPLGWLLASGSRDGTIGMWNVDRGLGHGRIEASHQPILAVGFHPGGNMFVAGGLDKVLRVWKIGAG
ncbi:MAG: DnaJ domain-containing protein [Fimbriimonadaceae bacterium]|nr:DnaJ domain-containing protein [Fimbriimonadaceae bacterium]